MIFNSISFMIAKSFSKFKVIVSASEVQRQKHWFEYHQVKRRRAHTN